MSLSSLDQSVYGPLYFSSVMLTGFYGITCMQTFFYFVHYREDPLRTKIFVAILWALDTVHDALTISGVYKYIVAGLVNPLSILDGVPYELNVEILFTVLVALPTQGFFIHRIYLFSGKNIVVPLAWAFLALYQLVAATIYVWKALYRAHGVQPGILGDKFLTALSLSNLSIAAVIDILISVLLTVLLLRERTSTIFPAAVHMLQHLTLFAVNTGIWSALFALLTLILLHVYPATSIYAIFGLSLSSVYCNTLLANLNARSYIRDAMATNCHISLRVTGASNTDQPSGEVKLNPTPAPLEAV